MPDITSTLTVKYSQKQIEGLIIADLISSGKIKEGDKLISSNKTEEYRNSGYMDDGYMVYTGVEATFNVIL